MAQLLSAIIFVLCAFPEGLPGYCDVPDNVVTEVSDDVNGDIPEIGGEMAVYTVHNITELYDTLGYWNDAGSTRVAGTAHTGDKVVTSGWTGTSDRGATNNILYPEAGVWFQGPGSSNLTIQGRLYMRGTGGTSVVSRFDSVTIDIKGYAFIGTGIGSSGAYGAVELEDTSTVCSDLVVTNSNTSAGINNMTVISNPASVASTAIFSSCSFHNAQNDCFSTKGANLSSNTYLYNCINNTPGTGATDQAATAHDGHKLIIVGGTYTGGTQKQAIVSDLDTTPIDIYNATITGAVTFVDTINGCVIDGNGLATPVSGAMTAINHTRVSNMGTTTASQGIKLTANTANINFNYIDIVGSSTAGPTALWISDTNSGTTTGSVNHLICSNVRRGVDSRQSAGGTVSVTYSTLSCGSYSILGNSGQPTTSHNIVDFTYLTISLDATDVLESNPTNMTNDLVTARSGVYTLTQPAPDVASLITSLLNGGGWAAPTITVTTQSSTQCYGSSVSLDATGHDAEEGSLTPTWTSSLDGALGTGTHLSVHLSTGTHVITATVTDATGQTASGTVNIVMLPNTVPTISIAYEIQEGDTVIIVSTVYDPEGEILIPTWTSSLDGFLATDVELITDSLSLGSHVITATVTDSGSLSASASVNINVVAQTQTFSYLTSFDKYNLSGQVVNTDTGATVYCSNSNPKRLKISLVTETDTGATVEVTDSDSVVFVPDTIVETDTGETITNNSITPADYTVVTENGEIITPPEDRFSEVVETDTGATVSTKTLSEPLVVDEWQIPGAALGVRHTNAGDII